MNQYYENKSNNAQQTLTKDWCCQYSEALYNWLLIMAIKILAYGSHC